MSKDWSIEEIAKRMREWIGLHAEVCMITVPLMQRELGRSRHLPPHMIEQAMHRLNLAGELGQAESPKKTHCCGDCRAAQYPVLRKWRLS